MREQTGFSVADWLIFGSQSESIPEETQDGWEQWVAKPVLSHMLAPREARAALEIIGDAVDRGQKVSEILGALVMITDLLPKAGIAASRAGRSLRSALELLNEKTGAEGEQ